jgi:hypothetical protein
VVGGNSLGFGKAITAVENIYQFLEQSYGQNALLPFSLGTANSVTASTRYLTQVMGMERQVWPSVPVPCVVDPKNILGKLISTGRYMYTEDNNVNHSQLEALDDFRYAIWTC